MSVHANRRRKLRQAMRKQPAPALLVTDVINVTYLTGFTGDSSYLIVTPDEELLISDSRYTIQLREECSDLPVQERKTGQKMLPAVVEAIQSLRVTELAVEAEAMTVGEYRRLDEAAEGVSLSAVSGVVEGLRVVKDKTEVAAIRVACVQARRAFEVVRASLTPGMTEKQVAADLEHQVRRFGGRGLSFPPIVGVGPRGALPHGTPSDRLIGEDPFVLIDWGANAGLYVSDLTRVLLTGKPPAKLRKVHETVLEAQLAAIDAIRPGVKCEDVDAVARKIITKGGYGKSFGHGLGHGIGLQVHEAPRMGVGVDGTLAAGMVVTVEPGIYLAEWGGVRIEDDVLVTKTGCEVLSDVPKQWDESFVA